MLREEESRKRKRQSLDAEEGSITLPGHSMVLLAYSGFCRTKVHTRLASGMHAMFLAFFAASTNVMSSQTHYLLLLQLENWSDAQADETSNSNEKHSIDITVPPGQLELAGRLIKGIYQKEPALVDLSPAQLLQLLLLADRYEVPKVQAAVLDALQAVPVADWDWQTVLDVLSLPPSCAEQDGCKAVVNAAAERLQQQHGDLEKVWADEQLQQQMLALPFSVLLRLLQDERTQVVSEHTVVHTILQWYQQQPTATRRKAQLKQLMLQVRMQHCSQLYIHTFMMHNDLVLKCFNKEELAVASLCVSAATVLQDVKCPLLQQYPAWTAAKRPLSNQAQVLEWHLPLEQLKAAVEKHLQDGKEVKLYGRKATLQGQTMGMSCNIATAKKGAAEEAGSSSSKDIKLGLFLDMDQKSPAAYKKIKCSFSAIAASTAEVSISNDITRGPLVRGFSGIMSWGFSVLLRLPSISSWADFVSVLNNKKLVHLDQCLHLQIDVTDMQ